MNPFETPQTSETAPPRPMVGRRYDVLLGTCASVVLCALALGFLPVGLSVVGAAYVALVFGRVWVKIYQAESCQSRVTHDDLLKAIVSSLAVGFLCMMAAAIGFIATCSVMNVSVSDSVPDHYLRLMLAGGTVVSGLLIYWLFWPRPPLFRVPMAADDATTREQNSANVRD